MYTDANKPHPKNSDGAMVFIKSKKDNTTFTPLQDEPVEEIQLPSIDKARNLLKQYKNSSNVKLYGMDRFLYQFISDEYKDDIEWNKDYIKIYLVFKYFQMITGYYLLKIH